MEPYILDIYLDDVNKEYLNKLTFLTLFRSRSLGFRCSADMFCEAYRLYDAQFCEELMQILEVNHICSYIIESCDICYKEDLLYLLRHPSRFNIVMDPGQKEVRKKVLHFFDIDEPGNEYKRESYDYLNSLRPVKRASQIDRILEQYLIKTKNEYFIEQAAARVMNNLFETVEFDEDGGLTGTAKIIVDTIWAVGSKKDRK